MPGQNGAQGGRGFSAWDTIPSGQTVTEGKRFLIAPAPGGATYEFTVDLPGRAPDASLECSGTVAAPTAPPGRACIHHLAGEPGTANLTGLALDAAPARGFTVLWTGPIGGGEPSPGVLPGLHRPMMTPIEPLPKVAQT